MTYYPNRPSRVSNATHATPRATLVFYTFLDALAFIMGVLLGAFTLGRMMYWYFFGL